MAMHRERRVTIMLTFLNALRYIVTKPKTETLKKNLRAKTFFLQKSCAQKNEKKSIPPKWPKNPMKKSKYHFWGIRFRDKTSGIYKPEVLEFSIHNSDKIEL